MTVFFGPFIGEFGWELLYWQGWVRKMCQEKYRDYTKIVCSFEGRQVFYPQASEFWSLPKLDISSKNYITDFWEEKKGIINDLLREYKARLPEDTIYHIPFELKDSLPFKDQSLEPIKPTEKGIEAFKKIYNEDKKIIAVFPRCRKIRRPDKNWDIENYNSLINMLSEKYDFKIAVLGEREGAFYADGVPEGVIDLINIPSSLRTDIQAAALQKSVLALGSMSGAVLFALACGTPSVTWGYLEQMDRYYHENYLNTRFAYYPKIKASPQKIFDISCDLIDNKGSMFLRSVPFLRKLSKLAVLYNRLFKS